MRLGIINLIKRITCKKDRNSQIQRSQNKIINYSPSTHNYSLSESQNENLIQLINMNVESAKAWALEANRNYRIV